MVGLNRDQILESRSGKGTDIRAMKALHFAKRVLETNGEVSEADLAAVRDAGFS